MDPFAQVNQAEHVVKIKNSFQIVHCTLYFPQGIHNSSFHPSSFCFHNCNC